MYASVGVGIIFLEAVAKRGRLIERDFIPANERRKVQQEIAVDAQN